MKENDSILSPLERAQKRVDELKRFYKHLTTYIIVNGILLLLAGKMTFILLSKEALGNPGFLEWMFLCQVLLRNGKRRKLKPIWIKIEAKLISTYKKTYEKSRK